MAPALLALRISQLAFHMIEMGFDAGFIKFLNNSTADHATITA